MLTQKKFEELVSFAQQGSTELMEALRMAEHEVTRQKAVEIGRLLRIIDDCGKFFAEHPHPESQELLGKCRKEISDMRKKANVSPKPLLKTPKEKEFIL
jgi:hypothetical protein